MCLYAHSSSIGTRDAVRCSCTKSTQQITKSTQQINTTTQPMKPQPRVGTNFGASAGDQERLQPRHCAHHSTPLAEIYRSDLCSSSVQLHPDPFLTQKLGFHAFAEVASVHMCKLRHSHPTPAVRCAVIYNLTTHTCVHLHLLRCCARVAALLSRTTL
jgi:hypothetical protein